MLRRLFWFALGVGFAMFVVTKVRGYLKKASPQALGNRVNDAATGVSGSARDFATRVRAAMVEREAELRDELGLPE
jgi:hypothetical protein